MGKLIKPLFILKAFCYASNSMNEWPTIFTVEPPKSNQTGWEPSKAVVQKSDEASKKAFAVLVANGIAPFEAACQIIKDIGQALWASQNWPNDPIVIAAREGVQAFEGLLDKNQIAARALKIADTVGYEAKDRIDALKLYAAIAGMIEKPVPTNNIINNSLKFIALKFVKPDNNLKEEKIIDQTPIIPEDHSHVKLKLVKSA